jgi:hypothetical protein
VRFELVEQQNCCTACTSLERNYCGSITLSYNFRTQPQGTEKSSQAINCIIVELKAIVLENHSSPLSGLTLMIKMTQVGLYLMAICS